MKIEFPNQKGRESNQKATVTKPNGEKVLLSVKEAINLFLDDFNRRLK